MANVLYSTGQKFNLLERGTVTLDNGTADALFGLSNLYDGRPALPFRFSSTATEEVIQVDGNQILGGNFEAFPFSDWTTTGTVTLEETIIHAGSGAAKLDGTGGGGTTASISQDIEARAGETREITAWLYGGGGANQNALVYIQNLATGRYLGTNGLWGATLTHAIARVTASYGEESLTYVVESYERCAADLVSLRVTIQANSGYIAYVDDVTDVPGVDLLGLFGLVVDDCCEVTWTTSDDGSSFAEDETAGDADAGFASDQRPNLYIKRATISTKRYHQIAFDNGSFPLVASREIGEMVLCEAPSLDRNHDWGHEIRHIRDRIRHDVADGSPHVYAMSRWPRRAFAATRQFVTEAQMRSARLEVWERAKGDGLNILLVPDDSGNIVLLGRQDQSFSVKRLFTGWYGENDLVVAELPFVSAAL